MRTARFETPSGSSSSDCPTTPTSSRMVRSAPPSCSKVSRLRKRFKRQLDFPDSARLTLSAPGACVKPEGLRKSRPHIITQRRGRDASRLPLHGYISNSERSYFDQLYEVMQVLANGAYSTTAVVVQRATDKQFVAKFTTERHSDFMRRQLVTEIKNHESIPAHPNVVEFIIGWEERGCAYLMMELCEMGALNRFFEPKKTMIPDRKLWSFFIDIVLALHHLHSLGMVHCDVKPANIMLTLGGVCKLGDFGLLYSTRRINSVDSKADENEGDGRYLAPESFEGYITAGTDIFSLGITLLELATPYVFRELHQSDIWSNGVPKPHLLEGVFPIFSELIHAMVVVDRFKRPSAAQLLAHPAVNQNMTENQALRKSLQI